MRKLILMLLVCGVAQADTRIENDFCHVPYDAGDVDNEQFIYNCGGVVSPRNGVATGSATLYRSLVDVETLPVELRNRHFELTYEDTQDEPCNLVDSNGTTYTSNDWYVRVTLEPWTTCADALGQDLPMCDLDSNGIVDPGDLSAIKALDEVGVRYQLACFDAVAQ